MKTINIKTSYDMLGGYSIEEAYNVKAFITNDVDTWGKRTILIESDSNKFTPVYLFPDEYEVVS